MFKTAKSGRLRQADQPAIWAEGRQHGKLDTRQLWRVGLLIARRSAADLWQSTSRMASDAALRVEAGLGALTVQRLGRVATPLPRRDHVVTALAGLSRCAARASETVDHRPDTVPPLEISNLRHFMDRRRAEARDHARAEAEEAARIALRPDPARSARERALAVKSAGDARLAALDLSLQSAVEAEAAAQPAEPFPETRPHVAVPSTAEALLAIRQAIAEAPAPAELPKSLTTAPPAFASRRIKPVSVFSAVQDWSDLASEDQPAARRQDAGEALPARPSLMRRLLLALWSRIVVAPFRWLWSRLAPAFGRLTTQFMGWALVGLLLPYGLARGIGLHLSHQDLADFD